MKRSVKSTKKLGKKTRTFKLPAFSKLLPRNKKSMVKAVAALIIIIAIGGAIPLPHTFAKTVTIPFDTDKQLSAELELNDSKIIKEGTDGAKIVQVKSLQSLWGRVFGQSPMRQEETTSIVSKPSFNKIVAEGTVRYQYMLCSDGSYRYFTDEKFKDVKVGFTSKSQDDCAANNKGRKVSLTNSNPSNTPSSASRPTGATQPNASIADEVDREVAKLKWCTEVDKRIGDEYIAKVQQAQAVQGITDKEFNSIVDPAYFKYSGNIGLLRASGCAITIVFPNYIHQ